MGKSAMRPSWTYKLGKSITVYQQQKTKKDLGVEIQDNLSSEKHILYIEYLETLSGC